MIDIEDVGVAALIGVGVLIVVGDVGVAALNVATFLVAVWLGRWSKKH